MGLHQINVGHVPEQDRLLVRISTTDKLEYRFWLTRLLVRGLWKGLLQRMEGAEPVRQQAAPQTRAAVLGFQHEKAVSESRFGEKYAQEALVPALPGEPPLVATINIGEGENGQHALVFRPRVGNGITVQFNDRMLHAFARLVSEAAQRAGWDLPLTLPATLPASTSTLN